VKLAKLPLALSLLFIAGTAWGQQSLQKGDRIEVTGSNIKRIQGEGALPLQVFTRQDIERAGIVSAEQLVLLLDSNGNGLDNLASNSDVVSGAARGNNGSTSANLRGQGANATLVLLNGRRIAAHGLNGGVVDLNQIPLAAIERVEVLKDGASAIYGTDAVGGVINFILRKDFTGINVQAFMDKTEAGGGDKYRASIIAGYGDLGKDGFNVMGVLTRRDEKSLRGDERSFVNTFQSNRGLSVDTRGTPYATTIPISTVRSILSSRNASGVLTNSLGPTQPGTTIAMSGGINALNLPGGAGCNSIADMAPYDYVLWAAPANRWACAWDTGKATVLQQPVEDTNFVGRAQMKLGNNATVFGEAILSNVVTKKSFSNNQLSSSTSSTSPLFNMTYPSTGASYNSVFNAIVALFPTIEENRGQGITFRWRCLPCGRRQLETTAKADRFLVGIEGEWAGWDYKTGISRAKSDVRSVIGGGYFFDDLFFPLLRNGILDPFGQTQTPAALAAMDAASARGVKLYGGLFTLTQADATVSGPVWKLPAGEIMVAAGLDYRQEKYSFQGDERDLANQRGIFNVPFDNGNALGGVKRDIKAVYGEALVPIIKQLEVTAAVRRDDYTGFGSTTNPKVSVRFQPVDQLLFRGGYNTGFRVPTFNQLFNGLSDSQFSGATLVDFSKCPAGVVSSTPGCESIRPVIRTGGKDDLGPEKSKQYTVGAVWAPIDWFSANADYWNIKRTGTIQLIDLTVLSRNFALFPDRFIRDATGLLVGIDDRWINAGDTLTRGVDVGAKLTGRLYQGRYSVVLDGAYLIEKKSRIIASAPYGSSEVAVYSVSGDLGLRWKHTTAFTYAQGVWSGTLTQYWRSGYKDQVLPGVANGTVSPPDWKPTVDKYITYNLAVTYTGIPKLAITGGVKNLLDKDPPFTVAYDSNTGAGSSWEPRVADPRGRSYTLLLSYTF